MNLIKTLFVLLCVILTPLLLLAQDAIDDEEEEWVGPALYVSKIKNKSSLNDDWISSFRNKILSGLQRNQRLTVIDGTSAAALRQESERRASGAVLDENTLFERVGARGANYILYITVEKEVNEYVTPEQAKSTLSKVVDGLVGSYSPYYKSTVTWTANIVNVKRGSIVKSKTYKEEGNSIASKATADNARENALSLVDVRASDIAYWLAPASGEIIMVESVNRKNTKAEEVVINVGSRQKLLKNERLNVYTTQKRYGETSKQRIGRLRVKEVVSSNRALCVVKEGEEEILANYKKNIKMTVKTY